MKDKNNKNDKKAVSYSGFSFKERLVPSLLLAFVIPFTVLFFGAFEIFGNNLGEFRFALGDFIGWNILFMLIGTALIAAILLPLRGRVFDTVYGVFFWLAVMLFVQGNYLTLGMNSLEGDGVGDSTLTTAQSVANIIVWLCILSLIMIAVFFIKKRDILKTGMILGCVLVIGMQVISFVTVSLTTDVYHSVEYRDAVASGDEPMEDNGNTQFLTYKNLDKVSKKGNVIVFVVDRFDNDYMEILTEDRPELLDELDGFTFYNDFISLYPRTFPAVTYMMTGVETDFSEPRLDYLESAFERSDFLKVLSENDYRISLYTDTYYGYNDAADIKLADNVSGNVDSRVVGNVALAGDMIRLSLYRYLPFALRDLVGNISTPDFNKYVEYDSEAPKYDTDMKNLYEYLKENPLELTDSKKNYSFIHFSGCHLPNKYDADFNPVTEEEEWSKEAALVQSFKIINEYIKQLKTLGVYDDATIIITGDHTSIHSDSKDPWEPHVTTMFVKRSGESKEGYITSHAQVSQTELFATILDSEGIESENSFGDSFFDVDPTETRTRKYYFQRYQSESGTYEMIIYEIKGTAHDFEANWKIVNRYQLGKSIYK